MASAFLPGGSGSSPARWPIPDPAGAPSDQRADDGLRVVAGSPRTGVLVVRAVGEIDLLTVEHWQRALDAACRSLAAGGRGSTGLDPLLVVDLTAIEFMAASGLGVLARLRDRGARDGVVVRLVAAGRTVCRPLEIVGLNRLLPLHADVTTALAASWPDPGEPSR